MSRFSSVLSIVAGVLSGLLGLLFMMGAAGHFRRVAIALIFLLVAAGLIGLGLRSLKRLALIQPEKLREDILEMARKRNGEIARSDVQATLGWRSRHTRPVIEAMMQEGRCRRALKGGETFYIFPELQPRLTVLYCEYCKAEYPISTEVSSCPNCGGPLSPRVAQRSLAEGEVFSMDENG